MKKSKTKSRPNHPPKPRGPLRIGVLGATGMVGEEFLRLLAERNFPVAELKLFASEKSAGQTLSFNRQNHTVQTPSPESLRGLELVFVATGDDLSREWSPQLVKMGSVVIDNSAAFRLSAGVPLVVPEVNGDILPQTPKPMIIANPNCSAIQLVVVAHALQQKFGVKAIRVASYQAVSGAGRAAREELVAHTQAHLGGKRDFSSSQFAQPMPFNVVPQIGAMGPDGFSSEERKIRLESRKILRTPKLAITAFTVRVPVLNAHSEAVWITLSQRATRAQVIKALRAQAGLIVNESLAAGDFPTAHVADGKDPVYVGRIHQDPDDPRTWLLWIVADNLRKGAALNAIQIAERLFTPEF